MPTALIPHWLAVLIGAGVLSTPFLLYGVFQCGALNLNSKAPFTHYQSVTFGLNLCAVGIYVWVAKYVVTGQVLLGLGAAMTAGGYASLSWWYRQNPEYIWRLFRTSCRSTKR